MNKTTLVGQLQRLAEKANAEAAKLPPDQARAARQESLAKARELVERTSGPELRLVNRAPLPRPGQTGMRRAEGRRP